MSTIENVIIIGSGPAGWTAAIYNARANLSPLVIAGSGERGFERGGQLTTTTEVENFPGFSEGIDGAQLMAEMESQAVRFGARVLSENVTRIDFSQRPFRVESASGPFLAHTLVLATGSTPKRLGIPGEDEFFGGRGVSSCATCDGAFFTGKTVAVVGGGDTAMEEASYLTHHAAKVYVCHRREELRASKIMQERVLKNPKIEVLWKTVVDEVLGTDFVESLRLRNVDDDSARDLPVDGMFLAIGHIPNSGLFEGAIHLDEEGYVLTDEHQHTNIEGVFVAGDLADHRYRQAITASGTGCKAGIEAERFLEALGDAD